MSHLQQHLKGVEIGNLAVPSNIKYGTAIYTRDGVEIISEQDGVVEAWAGGLEGNSVEGGGGRRRVQLWLKDKVLHWHCTSNPKKHDIFCKHCVAVALFISNG